MDEYRLYKAGVATFRALTPPIAMLVIGVVIFWGVLENGALEPGAPPLMVLWFGLVCWPIVSFLRRPRRIEWDANDRIAFIAPLRRVEVAPREVQAIKLRGEGGYLEIKTGRGKLVAMHRFQGFHEFLTRLKQANPDVEISGC